jgi:hypothetical protein
MKLGFFNGKKGDNHEKIYTVKAVRARCIDCSGFELMEVRECPFDGEREQLCPLYQLRFGKGSRTALKAIRRYCLWCCKGHPGEVKYRPAVNCALWEYRFGKRPRIAPFLPEILTTEGVFEAEAVTQGVEYRFDSICTEKGLSR